MLPTLDSVPIYWITKVACIRVEWFPRRTGAQEDPSVQYQKPLRTALRNTWRPIRTVTFVEPLSFLRHFHRQEGLGFTCMTLRLGDMLIHHLTHLFNVVGQLVCLKLMPIAPIQYRKRLFLGVYLIHRAFGAKPDQLKTLLRVAINLNMSTLYE